MRTLLDTNVQVAASANRRFCLDILQLVLEEHHLLIEAAEGVSDTLTPL